MLRLLTLTVVAAGICLLVIWKGGAPERLGAAFFLGNMMLGATISAFVPDTLAPTLDLVNDALIAVGFLALTLRYGSVWLGVAMLLYAAQFALHSYYFVMDKPSDLLHARVNNLNFLGVMLCIVVGTVTAWRRRILDRNKYNNLG